MLFDEYAARYARGERPDAREYVERAGDGGAELADLIDAFLARAPAPAPDAETVALFEAWVAGESPLRALAAERGLGRGALVDALAKALAIDPAKREKLAGYVHELEWGLLDTAGVSRRVWDALAGILGARAQELAGWRPRPLAAEAAMYRADDVAAVSGPPVGEEPDERDEVDELFTGGR
jgi:hypothetical protein